MTEPNEPGQHNVEGETNPETPLKIAIVEDDLGFAKIYERQLQKGDIPAKTSIFSDPILVIDAINTGQFNFDVLILDHNLTEDGEITGRDVWEAISKAGISVTVIGMGNSMEQPAYLPKGSWFGKVALSESEPKDFANFINDQHKKRLTEQ